ncbi:A disintegrin and metalloproteinase with thrombospondin motifs 14 [Eumeta japonica]|uniref:A disintegrin and metalloproteinase with thrombospondin motifs 14 n=1 Tax=Eumeta variegata TaxID=151549 RepID=A0A4C1T668_EUMVA|nr:A disintegrin and metalloproteinase with thrombospondin motifs 14 [Eumeta japonica]
MGGELFSICSKYSAAYSQFIALRLLALSALHRPCSPRITKLVAVASSLTRLGLTHDDSDSGCAGAARHASVMAPTVLATLHKYAWSRCSKDQFRKLSKTWTCMHYRSQDKGLELGGAKELSNYMFSMDDQCRTQFGEGNTSKIVRSSSEVNSSSSDEKVRDTTLATHELTD